MNYIVILISLIITSTAFSSTCKQGNLRWLTDAKLHQSVENICLTKSKKFIISKKCGKNCQNQIKKKVSKVKAIPHGTIGSPGFKLCRIIGGNGRLVQLNRNGWSNKSLCYFKDESFVEISYLLKEQSRI
ncbi:MAG: hypothetical protein HOJ35_00910 [Bdellovibrionales bacterium]|nr:hypothetical protein [Bdellovibrionales bacterium]